MFEEYVSIFDLKLPEILKSFNAVDFITTHSIMGKSKRKVDLFESEFANVLWFDYSFEGMSEIFIRPHKEIEGYREDVYYPIFSGGRMSSCGNVKSYSCKNPWSKIIKNCELRRREDDLCLDIFQYDDNIFFKKSYSEDKLVLELNYPYREVNKEIRSFHSLYRVRSSALYILTTYSNYGKYNLEVSTIDADGEIVKYEIVEDRVYRDGGTTYRTIRDPEGKDHFIFTPSRLNKNPPPATFDEELMIQIVDKDEIKETLKFTNTLMLSE